MSLPHSQAKLSTESVIRDDSREFKHDEMQISQKIVNKIVEKPSMEWYLQRWNLMVRGVTPAEYTDNVLFFACRHELEMAIKTLPIEKREQSIELYKGFYSWRINVLIENGHSRYVIPKISSANLELLWEYMMHLRNLFNYKNKTVNRKFMLLVLVFKKIERVYFCKDVVRCLIDEFNRKFPEKNKRKKRKTKTKRGNCGKTDSRKSKKKNLSKSRMEIRIKDVDLDGVSNQGCDNDMLFELDNNRNNIQFINCKIANIRIYYQK